MLETQLFSSLYQIGAVQYGDFTLKSGQKSEIYIDLRKIISYPAILSAVAESLWQKIKFCQFDLICGVPYTALPIATCLSLQHKIPMVMCRKEKKAYGTQQEIEGVFQPGQTCLIIEDVVTTGSSVLEVAEKLKSAGLIVQDAAVVINREQGGIENLQERNLILHAAFLLRDILNAKTALL